ncbi:MAG: hypothetical protein LUE65_11855 [Clostridiales bacterium]|nr:hypothetical protein [Clostridiales bacterium]
MRIKVAFRGTLINAKSEESRDGKNTYYKVSLDQNGEAGSMSCNKDVYDLVAGGQLEKYSEIDFQAVYNDQYKNMQVFDAFPVS